jgi:transposase
MRYVFLPPYSPDYNPIELTFSAMKAWFQYHSDAVSVVWDDFELAHQLLIHMIYSVGTPEKALGWYQKCHYIQ